MREGGAPGEEVGGIAVGVGGREGGEVGIEGC